MKILVHVGTPKTGSTTLQVSLIRSQKMLESNDITFFQGYTSLSGDRALISLYRTPPDIILKAHGGKERVIGVIAKRARGEMARFLIENEIQTTKGIEKFSSMGFKFRDFSNNCFTFVSS